MQKQNTTSALNLIPWPKFLDAGDDHMNFGDKIRIVTCDATDPLAGILADEIEALAGITAEPCAEVAPEGGDIVLSIAPDMQEEEYRLEIEDVVKISGGGYSGVAAGTVTFLQALSGSGDTSSLPVMKISDAPDASYRGLMVDVARCFHSTETLRQIINTCRWYKIRYLQLHLTDDQSFTFPSQAYPQLATPDCHYTWDELRKLEQYASERGVVLVPEFDVPGHSRAAVQSMPEIFATDMGVEKTINFVNPAALEAVDTIIGEMLEVFQSTPYFHIGADEVKLHGLEQEPAFQRAMQDAGVDTVEELFRAFIGERNKTVKSQGKQMIAWERFYPEGIVDIPRDILVMAHAGRWYPPDRLVEDGYTLINASWQPLYIVTKGEPPFGQWPVQDIYNWNMYLWKHFLEDAKTYNGMQLSDNAPVLGGQMCSWENPPEKVIPFVRKRLAAMGERAWNPGEGQKSGFADFSQRLQITDKGLEKMLFQAQD